MRDSGRLSATIAVIADFETRRVPLKTAMGDWARGARYAGAKDRAWIGGLAHDILRRRRSLAAVMDNDTPRAAALGALHFLWGQTIDAVAAMAGEEPHGPGPLSDDERACLARTDFGAQGDAPTRGDFPDWLMDELTRRFDDPATSMAQMAQRADVDLRINTLKASPEKAMAALKTVKARAPGIMAAAARIPAPPASEKSAAITVIPAFNKGWVEVQDLGSQIAAAAAGDVNGAQVLDFCAGGGGKTLALGAAMNNTGQLYAYDIDARRLKPLYARAKRAGLRNLQIINPHADGEALAALKGRMDVVFVDAPCSGSGTWRRHPDAKWRLTDDQLARRRAEQLDALSAARAFVKPGGRLIYVTCSILPAENEDQVRAFINAGTRAGDSQTSAGQSGIRQTDTLAAIAASGQLTGDGAALLEACRLPCGALQLTPDRFAADGFFIAALTC